METLQSNRSYVVSQGFTSSEDDDLARACATALHLGPTEVVKSDATAYNLPKTTHKGMYYSTCRDSQMNFASPQINSLAPNETNNGVPGFPDFPFFWTGEDGGSKLRKKLKEQIRSCNSKAKRQRLGSECKKVKITRKVVNTYGTLAAHIVENAKHRGRVHKKMKKSRRKEKRDLAKAKFEKKRQMKKDMKQLRKSLALLNCS